MNRRSLLVALTSILVLMGIMYVWRGSRLPQESNNPLIIGMMSGWAPFMSINGSGQYEGFDVDVANELGRRMNRPVIIQDLGSLSSCFIALDQGRIDAVMSGLDITQKRRETMNMVWYTGDNVDQFSLLFWNVIPDGVKTMNDMENIPGAIICVESGSAQEKFLDTYEGVLKKRLPSVTDIVLDLRFGKSLAAVLEPRVAARLMRQNPEIKKIAVSLPENVQVFGCGIAIKKDNIRLTDDIVQSINGMNRDGTLKKLETQWKMEE